MEGQSQGGSPKSADAQDGKLDHVYGTAVTKSFIPKNLLSEPLPDKFIGQMTPHERRQYNIWKEKYKTNQRQLMKQSEHEGNPKNKKFSLAP